MAHVLREYEFDPESPEAFRGYSNAPATVSRRLASERLTQTTEKGEEVFIREGTRNRIARFGPFFVMTLMLSP